MCGEAGRGRGLWSWGGAWAGKRRGLWTWAWLGRGLRGRGGARETPGARQAAGARCLETPGAAEQGAGCERWPGMRFPAGQSERAHE